MDLYKISIGLKFDIISVTVCVFYFKVLYWYIRPTLSQCIILLCLFVNIMLRLISSGLIFH